MRPSPSLVVVVLLAVLGAADAASALDQPISGHRVQLKQAGGGVKLVFVSKDPNFLFPAIGGADDPTVNGMTVEFIPATALPTSLTAGPGIGRPGWKVSNGAVPRYQYKAAAYALAGVSGATVQQGKKLKIAGKLNGVALPGGFEAVAVRVTIGSLRSCAFFAGAAIRKDAAGSFLGVAALAPAIADCSDESLGLPNCGVGTPATCGGPCPGDGVCTAHGGGCRCVSPSAPCGDTYPTCNGTCGLGEECLPSSAIGAACVCLPIGSTPCGETGPPTCGGACASGLVCRSTFLVGPPSGIDSFVCVCAAPEPCSSEAGMDCPNGWGCGVVIGSAGQAGCAAMRCEGTYPTCGGSCGDGGVCQPVIGNNGTGFCICAVAAPCDASCGGYDCPGGQVCDLDTSCGCITP